MTLAFLTIGTAEELGAYHKLLVTLAPLAVQLLNRDHLPRFQPPRVDPPEAARAQEAVLPKVLCRRFELLRRGGVGGSVLERF